MRFGTSISYSNLLVVKSSYYNLRNSCDLLLFAPKGITKKTLGDIVCCCGQIDSIHIFKKQLKFHIFSLSYNY